MNYDEFFKEAKRLNLRVLGTPEEIRAALYAKDAEIKRLRVLLESNAETSLLALTDKQRRTVFENFCRFCGTDDLPCQCCNDE